MTDIQTARLYLWVNWGYPDDKICKLLKKQVFSQEDEDIFKKISYKILKNEFKAYENPLEMNWSPVFYAVQKILPHVLSGLEDNQTIKNIFKEFDDNDDEMPSIKKYSDFRFKEDIDDDESSDYD